MDGEIIMNTITSMQRVLTTLSFKEPDKVPLFLLFSHYGAKELKIPIKTYFSNPNNIVEAQLKLLKKYRTDCLYGFFYASLELEAFGGNSIFYDDGPPNAGPPIINKLSDLDNLGIPPVSEIPCLQNVITAIKYLKKEVNDTVPIIGVVMSPFSLPVMQMGFESYLNLLFLDKTFFNKLMAINEAFCIDWANAQIEAGATAICYFDPVSSPSIITTALYRETGYLVAKRVLSQIKSAIATHMASGRSLAIIDEIASTGAAVVCVSSNEDLPTLKQKCHNRLSILGNLNGIEMCRWTPENAALKVKDAIQKAGKNGGFILSDNHGEIPWYVTEKVLMSISEATEKWGRYPIKEF